MKIIIANALLCIILLMIEMRKYRKHKHENKPRGHVRFGIVLRATKGSMSNISGQLTTAQETTLTAQFEDSANAVVPVQGVPSWSIDNPAVASITPAADGMSCLLVALTPGTATVTVTAEGDPTPGKDTITGTIAVTVVPDEATQVVLSFGTPVAKPAS